MEIPVTVVAGFYPLVARTWAHFHYMPGTFGSKLRHTLGYLPGYLIGINAERAAYHWTGGESVKWEAKGLTVGLFPILTGIGLHIAANQLGINKALDKIGFPLLRV